MTARAEVVVEVQLSAQLDGVRCDRCSSAVHVAAIRRREHRGAGWRSGKPIALCGACIAELAEAATGYKWRNTYAAWSAQASVMRGGQGQEIARKRWNKPGPKPKGKTK